VATRKTTAGKNSNEKKAEDVSEFLDRLEHPLKPEIQAVRQIILGANDQIREEIEDPSGELEWIAKDRGAAKFRSMSDVMSKRPALEDIVNQWIESMKEKQQ